MRRCYVAQFAGRVSFVNITAVRGSVFIDLFKNTLSFPR